MSRDEVVRLASVHRSTCWLCDWILKDLEKNGKLTGWPYDFNDKSNFPPESKILHLEVERISVDNR